MILKLVHYDIVNCYLLYVKMVWGQIFFMFYDWDIDPHFIKFSGCRPVQAIIFCSCSQFFVLAFLV